MDGFIHGAVEYMEKGRNSLKEEMFGETEGSLKAIREAADRLYRTIPKIEMGQRGRAAAYLIGEGVSRDAGRMVL